LWKLDLAEPYGSMIMEECIFLANFRAGCYINKLQVGKVEVPLSREVREYV